MLYIISSHSFPKIPVFDVVLLLLFLAVVRSDLSDIPCFCFSDSVLDVSYVWILLNSFGIKHKECFGCHRCFLCSMLARNWLKLEWYPNEFSISVNNISVTHHSCILCSCHVEVWAFLHQKLHHLWRGSQCSAVAGGLSLLPDSCTQKGKGRPLKKQVGMVPGLGLQGTAKLPSSQGQFLEG